jgi:hypothetical protein
MKLLRHPYTAMHRHPTALPVDKFQPDRAVRDTMYETNIDQGAPAPYNSL